MAVVAAQVSVGTAAVRLSLDSDSGGTSVLVQAPAGATLFVGGPAVTAAVGFPVAAGSTLAVDLPNVADELWGVLASGSGVAAVLRVGA